MKNNCLIKEIAVVIMKNRTIYDALDQIMENYTYSVSKNGRKVELKGSVYIERIDIEVSHEKSFYVDPDGRDSMERNVAKFKEELRKKVCEVVKDHQDELTDDEAMIEKLLYEIKALNKENAFLKKDLKEANEKITKLELEKITLPYTGTTPTIPWWQTGITYCSGDSCPDHPEQTLTCNNTEKEDGNTFNINKDWFDSGTFDWMNLNKKRFG